MGNWDDMGDRFDYVLCLSYLKSTNWWAEVEEKARKEAEVENSWLLNFEKREWKYQGTFPVSSNVQTALRRNAGLKNKFPMLWAPAATLVAVKAIEASLNSIHSYLSTVPLHNRTKIHYDRMILEMETAGVSF